MSLREELKSLSFDEKLDASIAILMQGMEHTIQFATEDNFPIGVALGKEYIGFLTVLYDRHKDEGKVSGRDFLNYTLEVAGTPDDLTIRRYQNTGDPKSILYSILLAGLKTSLEQAEIYTDILEGGF